MGSRWWLLLLLPLPLCLFWLRAATRRRCQRRFIRQTLSEGRAALVERRVIVSLSTIPDRMGQLAPTLQSLVTQTRPPDEIILAIPDYSLRQEKGYVVPNFLSDFSTVRLLRCGRDWGPATKSIPIVQEELAAGRPGTLIMVVDDDRTYPPDALETYLHYHLQLPDAALCFRGSPMPRNLNWHSPSLRHPKLRLGSQLRVPQRVAVMTGCGSYLIQPGFFDSKFWDYSAAPPGAFYMDDIWVSGWLDRRDVKKYVIPTSAMMKTVWRQSRTMTLAQVPGGRLHNNNEAIAFFRDSWDVFLDR